MRYIEFRVWDTKTKQFLDNVPPFEEWLDSDSWDDPEDLMNDPYLWQIPPTFKGRLIWQQFTGAHDKNGNKIFEGDILNNPIYGKMEIKWDNLLCGWIAITTSNPFDYNDIINFCSASPHLSEIVGHINN